MGWSGLDLVLDGVGAGSAEHGGDDVFGAVLAAAAGDEVERRDGQELRLYDLRTGEHTVWLRRPTLRQPVWNALGGKLIVSTPGDTVFEGPPDATSAPQPALTSKLNIEGFAWLPDGRLVATNWAGHLVLAVHLDRRPPSFDTLATSAVMGRLSPDGRWLAYNAPDFGSAWVEPFPGTGQRYPAGSGDYPQWLSPSEFVMSTDAGHFERIKIDASMQPPRVNRQSWFDVPRFVSVASGGFGLTPDGKVIYKEGAPIAPIRYLHVIPNWVPQMKRAVAEGGK